MKQITLKTALAAGIALLTSFSMKAQMGGTSADNKMRESGGRGQGGGLYTPSLFDGTANIDIPIYQYSLDKGEYGVSLTYNTAGVKLDEPAGQIGLHWVLAAGGRIQHVVKDLPDELYRVNDSFSYYEQTGQPIRQLPNPFIKNKGRFVCYGETVAEAAETDVYRDSESDDYIVSMSGLSFTFNLGKNGFVYTIPQRNVKVELLLNGNPVTSLPALESMGTVKFRITDEGGNRYLFKPGDLVNNVSISNPYVGIEEGIGGYGYYANWVIEKVTAASGAEINYSYSSVSKGPQYMNMSIIEPDPGSFGGQGPKGAVPLETNTYLKLDAISYPNNTKVQFVYDATKTKDDMSPALREIKVLSNDQVQLRYQMDQAYFLAPDHPAFIVPPIGTPYEFPYDGVYGTVDPNNPVQVEQSGQLFQKSLRLKLKGIKVAGAEGTGISETLYTFDYEAMALPARFDGRQDYFGYYNGISPTQYPGVFPAYTDMTLPLHTPFSGYPSTPFGADKTPDANYAKASLLKTIQNAYGGTTEFQYESHDLSPTMNSTSMPGYPLISDLMFMGEDADDGVRLQKIIEHDPFNPRYKITTFTYDGGQQFMTGGYYDYPVQVDDASPSTVLKKMVGNQYVTKRQLVNGTNHGYSNVTVTSTNNLGEQLSRSEYTFTNFVDGNGALRYQKSDAGSKYFYEFPFAEKQFIRNWEMGLPLTVKNYDENNKIVNEVINSYSFTTDLTTATNQIENTRIAKVKTDNTPFLELIQPALFTDNYRPFRGRAELISTQVKKYVSDNSFVNDIVTYHYDTHRNCDYSTTANSRGEKFRTLSVFNYNLASLPGSGLQAFTDAGLEKMISQQRWKMDAAGTTYQRLMDGFISTFNYQNQKVTESKMYTFIPGGIVTRSMYVGGASNDDAKVLQAFSGTTPAYFRKSVEVMLADSKGNVLESHLGDQDMYKAMIWHPLSGKKLAEAGNCHFVDIAYDGFDAPGMQGNVTYNASQLDLSPQQGAVSGGILKLSNLGSDNKAEGTQVLQNGKNYILTFWARGGTPAVYYGNTGITPASSEVAYLDWHFYSVNIQATNNTDKFSIRQQGAGTIYLDEVRFFPASSQMQSWTYTPMFGPHAVTDPRGRMSFQTYDGLGRSTRILDQNGNILSRTEYHVEQ